MYGVTVVPKTYNQLKIGFDRKGNDVMGKLEYYASLEEKKQSFNLNDITSTFFTIDYAYQFKDWYDAMNNIIKENPLANFFRGVGEARYKLYNSAQRFWIENNLTQLESLSQPIPYIDMIANMINNAREQEIFQRVFD